MTRVFMAWIFLSLALAACGSGNTLSSESRVPSPSSAQQLSMSHLSSLPGYSRFERSGLELNLVSKKTDELGMTHLRYQQQYQNLPLQYAELMMHVKQGAVYRVDGQLAELDLSSTTPDIDAEQAVIVATAFKQLSRPYTYETRLLITATNRIYNRLAWEVTIRKGLMRHIFLVDAKSGMVIKEIPGINTFKQN